jgi:hypothetical protein
MCLAWVKVGKKEPSSVWIVLENCLLKIRKITMGTLYIQKNYCSFEIGSLLSKLQLQNFHENSPCFKSPFICLKHSRKTCGQEVFLYQKSFSLIKCSPNRFNFLVNFNVFHKKGSMCSKNSKYKNTYIILDFKTRMSFYIIIVLNL